jgi:precorrin-2 dehydrogenase/sirohydrochlorin ferrochelatase
MLPLSLDISRLRLALIGNGAAALRRLALLDEAGSASVTVFSETPAPELAARAAGRLQPRWPLRADLAKLHLVFIADLPEPERSALAMAAREAGVIVHVEDAPGLSDVHAPAVLRRGDLTIAISTAGAAPGLAAELKQFLGGIFGSEWAGRVLEIKTLRQRWRRAGATHDAIRRLTASRIARYGWLTKRRAQAANDHGRTINKLGGES